MRLRDRLDLLHELRYNTVVRVISQDGSDGATSKGAMDSISSTAKCTMSTDLGLYLCSLT